MLDVEIDLKYFVIGEAIIGVHPLTNALTTLFFLRPYRKAFKKIYPYLSRTPRNARNYDNMQQVNLNAEITPPASL